MSEVVSCIYDDNALCYVLNHVTVMRIVQQFLCVLPILIMCIIYGKMITERLDRIGLYEVIKMFSPSTTFNS